MPATFTIDLAWRRTAPLLVVAFVASTASARAADVPLTIHTNDGDAVSACVGAGLAAMREDLRREALGRAEQDAWRLVHALACARGREAQRVIAAHLRGPIPHRIEPDPPEITYVDARAERLRDGYLRGLAWGARIEGEQRDLSVQFSTNDYCWAGATLRYDGTLWWLVALNAGCD